MARFWDVINSWRALAEARQLAECLLARSQTAEAAAEEARKDLLDTRTRWKIHTNAQSREITHLRNLVEKGHFRDPANGRLGRKGEIPRGLLPTNKDVFRDQ